MYSYYDIIKMNKKVRCKKMKQKILTMITIGGIFLMVLTGCGDSSGNRTASDSVIKSDAAATDKAEHSDGSDAEMTKDEAEREIDDGIEEEIETEIEAEIEDGIETGIEEGIEAEIEAGIEGGIEEKNEEESVQDTENPVVRTAGLYQSDGSFIPWDNLNIDVETDYAWENFETEAKSPHKVITDNNYDGELVLPDNITSIGERAFEACESLTSIDLRNTQITVIGTEAFYYCFSLARVDLPDTLTSIGEDAFGGCESLTHVDLPDNIASIGWNAFEGCISLECIDLSNTQITVIGGGAFEYCESLTHVDLPDTITRIEAMAFDECTSLESISLPDTLTSIELNIFYECTSLTNIDYAGTMEEWNRIDKDDYWNHGAVLETITCADGVINL